MKNISGTMKGVYLTGHGGKEKLEYRDDIPIPKLGPYDVLVRVAAAAVNNTDINTRKGWYSKNNDSAEDAGWSGGALSFPRIQGADVCGRVVSVGDKVDGSRIGERILIEPCLWNVNGEILSIPWYFGSECNGGFAEYTVVPSVHAYTIKSDYSDIELASFPCSYSTAENLLTRANVKKGERILITGASGGVGSAALQLAKARKAHVVAITSPSKKEGLTKLGADEVIIRGESLTENLGLNNVDVVIDLVAGEQWPELLEVLKPGGRYAVSGAIGGPIVQLDVRTLYLKDLSLFGCTVLEREVFKNLISRIQNKDIIPVVAKTYPLDQITQAQDDFQQKKHIGKLVLTVQSG
ncbi:MAG: zinc-binding dehydrogenase [Gammaproteobacteria bacterium]|mgnify:CR=1 FL=1|jgi:NADPH:quinone reductase-like Zn-dependent oxidoreductase|nr:zinc-binding dehydrogenase [Gammaproteobacteria bacterium]MBT3722718.1 zinc-binding dehydrogenase [Gammaproteobacteria bacterium]MBT4077773.1 zinc-binding dehydrogenase [Gammaproteobacteria bacterium]MBT4195040.1 zinc-binding dehydrogenase [Gammaproteobacteria bacterium]MBT4452245.1 zinc-binding dehydrogenase [Gammaproteobacteria bacterium]